jgi:hypothetical protein
MKMKRWRQKENSGIEWESVLKGSKILRRLKGEEVSKKIKLSL